METLIIAILSLILSVVSLEKIRNKILKSASIIGIVLVAVFLISFFNGLLG